MVEIGHFAKDGDARAIAAVVQGIDSPEAKVRVEAAEAFQFLPYLPDPILLRKLLLRKEDYMHRAVGGIVSQTDDPRAVPVLLQFLEDPRVSVRQVVISSFAELADPRAITPLNAALQHESDPQACMGIIQALAAIDDPRVMPLLSATLADHKNADVRAATARALGNRKDASALTTLTHALQQDTQGSVRAAAAYELSVLGDKRAVAALRQALSDPSTVVRANAALALIVLGEQDMLPTLLTLLHEKDAATVSTTAFALGETKDLRAVVPLLNAYSEDPGTGTNIFLALIKIAYAHQGAPELEPIVTQFAGMLSDRPSDLIRIHLGLLGSTGRLSAVEPLIAFLDSRNNETDWIASTAIRGLGNIPSSPRAVAYLHALAENDDTHGLKNVAIFVLASQGDPEYREKLQTDLVTNKGTLAFGNAAQSLGMLGGDQALATLLAALQTTNEGNARDQIVHALLFFPPEHSASAVEPLAADLQTHSALSKDICNWLGKAKDPRAAPPLLETLTIAPIPVQVAVIKALGQIGDPRAVEPLKALQNSDSALIRSAVKKALATIGNKS